MAEQPAAPASIVEDEAVETAVEPLTDRIALEGRGLREHTARGAIINSLFQAGIGVLGLFQRVAVAALLTITEYGLWGLIVTALITLAWLKQIGIADKFVQQDEADQEAAFQKAFTLELVYSAIFFVIACVAFPLLGRALRPHGDRRPGDRARLVAGVQRRRGADLGRLSPDAVRPPARAGVDRPAGLARW